MAMEVKIIFTVFAVVVGTAICFIDSRRSNAGPDWVWRLGKGNVFQSMVCRPGGTFRRYTKLGLLLWFAVLLAVVWLLPGASQN